MKKLLTIAAFAFLLTGCYSASVTTQQAASQKVVEKRFATGLINGLATPGAHFSVEQCQYGVAQVESKISFLNMVASGITFGLYTPMHVRAVCAAKPEDGPTASTKPVPMKKGTRYSSYQEKPESKKTQHDR
jgi:hypothetical protein